MIKVESKVPIRQCKECNKYFKHGKWVSIKDVEIRNRIANYGVFLTVCPQHETKIFPKRVRSLTI